MTDRERTLAMLLLGGILLGGGALLGYMFVYTPYQAKRTAAENLENEITDLDSKIGAVKKLAPRIAEAKRQSLPPDTAQAALQYQQLMEYLRPAGLPNPGDFSVKQGKNLSEAAPVTPALGPKRPAYKRLEFVIDIDNATVWQVAEFLYRFYQVDLLHRITELKIVRQNKPTDVRSDLKATITVETLILDGVEHRSGLFPVTGAVAAVGGYPAVHTVAQSPALLAKLTPVTTSPVLAARPRDYTVIVRYDPFYGLLPPPESEPPFRIERLSDVTVTKPEEAPSPVRVRLSGKGATGGKIEAKVTDGDLFPKGPLTVDPKALTVALPKVNEEAGVLGSPSTATISVTAVSADGEKKEASFKVAMGKDTAPPVPTVTKPDISAAIKLVGFAGSSEGDVTTITAVIFDSANPFAYKIVAKGKTLEVVRQWSSTTKSWRKDLDYERPAGILAFFDDFSSTNRTFRVIALEEEAVVVADLGGTPPAKNDAPRPGGSGKFGGGRQPKQGKAEPLAVVAGNPAVAVPQPVYYRWPIGKSLKEVVDPDPKNPHRLPAEEVKKILKRVAEVGPLASVTSGN